MKISVIIPFYNEEDNVAFVLDEVTSVLRTLKEDFEIVAIDDGSCDQTNALLKKREQEIPEMRLSTHPKKSGQGAAYFSGLRASVGDVIILMDGDGQNDFRDVERMLPLLQNYDAVMGQRTKRNDPLTKRLVSKMANRVRSSLLRDGVTDTCCSLKILKRYTLEYLIPIRGFFRFIPFLLNQADVPFTTCDVHHRPRKAGNSKYSLRKLYFLPTIFDLLFMLWYKRTHILEAKTNV